jgi:V/A-type H+-transporting ATPase subunit I
MQQLSALVLKEDADALTRKLLNLGVMDFIDTSTTEYSLANRLETAASASSHQAEEIQDLKRRVEMFLQTAGIELPDPAEIDAEQLNQADTQQTEAFLEQIASQVQEQREQQQRLQQEIGRCEELIDQISAFDQITELSPDGSYADAIAGTIGESRLSSLQQGLSGLPVYIHTASREDRQINILLIYLRRDEQKVSAVLDRVQWKQIDIPQDLRGSKKDVIATLRQQKKEAENKQKELARKAETLITDQKDRLLELWKELAVACEYASMQNHYASTGKTMLLTGWIPASKKDDVIACFEDAAPGRYYMEWKTPETDRNIKSEEVPVELEHSRTFLPFQWLVENYSLPRYGTIDPTLLVALTYLIMFALMFGDAGHGAVLCAAGALVLLFRRNKHQGDDTVSKLAKLIIWCGGSAIIAGILFGSYFGYQWFPPLWFDYHSIVSGHTPEGGSIVSSIYDILGITIKFGIGVIFLGIVLNCINRFRSRDYFHLLFDTGGLLGGWFYAGGVAAGFHFVSSGYTSLPGSGFLLAGIGIPLLAFAAKAPVNFARNKKQQKMTPSVIMDFFMDWIVELLELFTGYLSNTLSFMRIAGLGIAHVSLMTAFFQIADTIDSTIASIAVLVLGNAVVIVLEGLSAGIQSLRLHYYEFFTKYFCGTGRVYKPISLRRLKV